MVVGDSETVLVKVSMFCNDSAQDCAVCSLFVSFSSASR